INLTVSSVHCGCPGLSVNCSSTTLLALRSDMASHYYIMSFDYQNRLITLWMLRSRASPARGHSPMLWWAWYSCTTSVDANLSFYFNRTMDKNNSEVVSSDWVACLGNYMGRGSYVFKSRKEVEGFDWVRKCEEKVLVTVKEAEALVAMGSANNGFVMEWSADEGCRPRGVRTVALSVGSITGLGSLFAFAAM
ncbi:hypothetical protein CRG98_049871, partial [Punica granatum]